MFTETAEIESSDVGGDSFADSPAGRFIEGIIGADISEVCLRDIRFSSHGDALTAEIPGIRNNLVHGKNFLGDDTDAGGVVIEVAEIEAAETWMIYSEEV